MPDSGVDAGESVSVALPPADAGALERLPGLPTAESAEDAELS